MAKKIAFLLYGGPHSQSAVTVAGLSEAALRRGLDVDIFFMYEAVLNSTNQRYLDLADKGANITVCSHNSDEVSATRSDKFKYGSQYDHASIVNEADRYVAFT